IGKRIVLVGVALPEKGEDGQRGQTGFGIESRAFALLGVIEGDCRIGLFSESRFNGDPVAFRVLMVGQPLKARLHRTFRFFVGSHVDGNLLAGGRRAKPIRRRHFSSALTDRPFDFGSHHAGNEPVSGSITAPGTRSDEAIGRPATGGGTDSRSRSGRPVGTSGTCCPQARTIECSAAGRTAGRAPDARRGPASRGPRTCCSGRRRLVSGTVRC